MLKNQHKKLISKSALIFPNLLHNFQFSLQYNTSAQKLIFKSALTFPNLLQNLQIFSQISNFLYILTIMAKINFQIYFTIPKSANKFPKIIVKFPNFCFLNIFKYIYIITWTHGRKLISEFVTKFPNFLVKFPLFLYYTLAQITNFQICQNFPIFIIFFFFFLSLKQI